MDILKKKLLNNGAFTMSITGRPKSGKSHLISYIIKLMTQGRNIYNKFNYGLIFSYTLFNKNYDFLDDQYKYNTFEEEPIKNLMAIQQGIREQNKQPPLSFIIFDDMVTTKDFNKSLFTNLLFNYRHYNICIIIASQYCNAIPAKIRDVMSFPIIFMQYTKRSIEACYESYFQLAFDTYNDAKKFLDEHLIDHKFLFVDTMIQKNNFNERFIIMKAPAKIGKIKFKMDNIKLVDLHDDKK